MKSRSPSDCRVRRRSLAALLCLLALPAGLAAHPDIGSQVERLDAEIAAQPADVDRLLRRGDLARREGRYADAAADLGRARQLDPVRAEPDLLEGRLLLDQGQAAAAERVLGRYLAQQPGHAAAWALRGEARLQAGLMRAAAADFSRAIRLAQRPAPALYLARALALRAAGEAYASSALEAVDEGLERFPAEVSLRGVGADIALARGEDERARRYIEGLPPAIRELPQWRARALALGDSRRMGPE